MANKATNGSPKFNKGDWVWIVIKGGHQITAPVQGRLNKTEEHPFGGIRLSGDQHCVKMQKNTNGDGSGWAFHNRFGNHEVDNLQPCLPPK